MKSAMIILCAAAVLFTGCASSGVFASGNMTNVELSKGNFKIVMRDAVGEAASGSVFGVSQSFGAASATLAIAHVSGSKMLYADAIANLWKSAEKTLTTIEGRKLALVNVRYDAEVLNLIVYTQVTVSVRADIVEFSE